jgi:hypothetical protein
MKLRRNNIQMDDSMIGLELTPPAFGDKPVIATQQLFTVLHGLGSASQSHVKSFRLSLEIIATQAEGIRYVVRMPDYLTDTFEEIVGAYLPEVRVTLDTKPIDLLENTAVARFGQQKHFAYPLRNHELPDSFDPIVYIAGAMTKLAPSETAVFQLVIRPINMKRSLKLRQKLLRNEDVTPDLQGGSSPLGRSLVKGLNKLSFALTDSVTYVYHGSSRSGQQSAQKAAATKHDVQQGLKPARSLTSLEQEQSVAMYDKLAQPLFQTEMRALVSTTSVSETKRRVTSLCSALTSYSVNGYQALVQKRSGSLQDFQDRVVSSSIKHSAIFSVSEVAGLYHFPHSETARTENVIKALSRSLAAPLSLKSNPNFDVVLGVNDYHGTKTAIGLTAAERERHVYIIGGTGNGKTTMLQYAIVQDMQAGKGLAVVDPHGDMAETLLEHVPLDRLDDVVYFNPDDIGYPIGLNLLELPEGLSDDELIREKDLITESVISIFRKIFSDDDSGGHRVEYVLRNAVQTALTAPDATLFTIFELLNNPKYRKQVVGKLDNEDLKNFWRHEIGKAGEMQRVKMAAGITAKIGRFLFSASAKRILEQPKSTIDFDDIVNSGKILICNFSKGLLGEDTSELFGITVLAKLQLTSLRRARIAQSDRLPFYLYVDEFQNFATQSFVQMLSESRKYKLFIIMAEQSTSQQQDKDMVNIVLANTGTVLSFRTGNPEDERLLLPLFSPFLEKNEIANQAPYNFYARLSATKSQEPVSGSTLLLPQAGNSLVAAEVILRSRSHYALEVRQPKETKPQPVQLTKKKKQTLKPIALSPENVLEPN